MSISVNSDFCLLEPAAWNLINFRALIRQTETADIRQRPPAGYLVPQADGRDLVERPFGAVVRGAEAVARIVHYGTIRSGSAGHALVSSGFSRKASWRGTKVSLDAAISSMLHQRNSQKLSRSSTVRAVGIGSKDGTR